MNNKAKTIFDENEMIELCQELGTDIVQSETGEPQLNEKDLEIEDIFIPGTYNYCIYYNARYKKFSFSERYSLGIGEIYFDNVGHAKQACDVLNNEFDEEYMEDFFNGNQD